MNDLKTLYTAIQSVEIPVEMPEDLADNVDRWFEEAHTPYIDEKVQLPEYPVPEQEEDSDTDSDANVTTP